MTGSGPFDDPGASAPVDSARQLRDEDAAGSFAGVGTTDDGLVTARVDGGRLQSLDLDPKAMRKSGDELARLVLAATRRARADHVVKREERVVQLGLQPPSRAEIEARLARIQQLVRESEGDMRTVADRVHADRDTFSDERR